MVVDLRIKSDSPQPTNFIATSSAVYFTADDGVHGEELWKTDGTAPGTVLVKDIHPSPYLSYFSFSAVGSMLYFTTSNGTNGNELWKSDGTPGGTVMVSGALAAANGKPQFDGNLNVRSSDLRALMAWLKVDVAGMPGDRLRNATYFP